jgi:diadenosine tetraphosphate (Ap4A) HIT family hydrolase
MVPRLERIEELWDLTPADRARMFDEVTMASEIIRDCFDVTRMNVADIGNKVAQMHIHVVGRTDDDAAWPKVVWSRPYEHWTDRDAFADRQRQFQTAFADRSDLTRIDAHTDPGVAKL